MGLAWWLMVGIFFAFYLYLLQFVLGGIFNGF